MSKAQYDRVWSYIEAGKREGAQTIVGGTKRQGKGYYVDPTSMNIQSDKGVYSLTSVACSVVFTNIHSNMKIVTRSNSVTELHKTLILYFPFRSEKK